MTAAVISADKRYHLVGHCHSDTSHSNSVPAQIARVAAATIHFNRFTLIHQIIFIDIRLLDFDKFP